MKIQWPDNKKFAFSIVDDTDNATVENVKPIYDLLYKHGIITTKSVWLYPSRNSFKGESLYEENYLNFIYELIDKGFEIALHNVGSGSFERNEIMDGIETFHEKLNFYPNLHINHANNPDNIYWGNERYQLFLRTAFKLWYGNKRKFYGTCPNTKYFWGDICKERIKYIRNYTFNEINTLKKDSKMPWIDKNKESFSNYWFSSSDGHTVEEFNSLLTKEKIDSLQQEGGACIVYTHFASNFVNKKGQINRRFEEGIQYLSSKDGWFVPTSSILDFLLGHRESDYVSKMYLFSLDCKWILDRIIKKYKYKR